MVLEVENYKKVVGVKQTLKHLNDENCICLCIANDAEKKIVQQLIDKALDLSVEIKFIETMAELGKICDIDVGAAAALFLKK